MIAQTTYSKRRNERIKQRKKKKAMRDIGEQKYLERWAGFTITSCPPVVTSKEKTMRSDSTVFVPEHITTYCSNVPVIFLVGWTCCSHMTQTQRQQFITVGEFLVQGFICKGSLISISLYMPPDCGGTVSVRSAWHTTSNLLEDLMALGITAHSQWLITY